MRPRKSCQEKILSNFAYTGTNKACQGQPVKENLFVVQITDLIQVDQWYRLVSEFVKK